MDEVEVVQGTGMPAPRIETFEATGWEIDKLGNLTLEGGGPPGGKKQVASFRAGGWLRVRRLPPS
jgi:hypothetical protein